MKKQILLSILILANASYVYSQEIQTRVNSNRLYQNSNSESSYGAGNSLGFTLFGDGLGMMFRHTFLSENQFGAYLGYAPILIQESGQLWWISGFLFKPEFNFYIGSTTQEKQKANGIKRKLKKRYISLKEGIGYSSGPFHNQQLTFWRSSTTLSYHQQRFLNDTKHKSTGFDLGISYDYFFSPNITFTQTPISIYLRWDWAWFMR